jgi:hypothetical protein
MRPSDRPALALFALVYALVCAVLLPALWVLSPLAVLALAPLLLGLLGAVARDVGRLGRKL